MALSALTMVLLFFLLQSTNHHSTYNLHDLYRLSDQGQGEYQESKDLASPSILTEAVAALCVYNLHLVRQEPQILVSVLSLLMITSLEEYQTELEASILASGDHGRRILPVHAQTKAFVPDITITTAGFGSWSLAHLV